MQQLIYESAVPLSSQRHGKASIELGDRFGFARHVNSLPLMTVEFAQAATEYAIVFSTVGEAVVPLVVVGARKNENLYLSDDERWLARYVPAFVRRYPFIFLASDGGKTFTLCVDESCAGLNYKGQGSALFDADGHPTPYVEGMLRFLQEFRLQFQRTETFGRRLKELDVLEPMQARFTLADDTKLALTGFMVVSRERLKAVPERRLAEMMQSDELELVFLHLQSLNNLARLRDRLQQRPPAADGGTRA